MNMEKEFKWYQSQNPSEIPALPDEVVKEVQNRILYALECLVKPGIKEVVTKGKLRWRGIKRKTPIIYKNSWWEVFITDDGSIQTTYLGNCVLEKGKNVELKYPILVQRNHFIDLNFDFAEFQAYDFWLQKKRAINFGYGRKLGRGILDRIVKIE